MMFAFSRDRAVPGHQLWSRVSKRDRIPIYTVWAIAVLAFLTPLPAWWFGYTGYAASTAVAVIGLYIAFMLPIILRLRAGERFERGAWHLGRHYKWIDLLAILWIVFICIVFMLPFNYAGVPWHTFDWNLFNYTPVAVRSRVPPLRRLVRDLGQELVQRPDPPGHRRGARADRAGVRRG